MMTINIPSRHIFEQEIKKPPTETPYIFVTDEAKWCLDLVGPKSISVYIAAAPETNVFTLEKFLQCITAFGTCSRDYFYIPICCSAKRNKDLATALESGGFRYSPDAWKTFRGRDKDYFVLHPGALAELARQYVKTCGEAPPGIKKFVSQAQEAKQNVTASSNDCNTGNKEKQGGKNELLWVDTVEPKDIKWLWYPYIALNSVTLMRGDPGQGKTTVCLTLASIVSNGWSFPASEMIEMPKPGNVLYLSAEDSLSQKIVPGLIKAGANLKKIATVAEDADLFSFTSPTFERFIKESDARLVIIDPLQAYIGTDVDCHRTNQVRPVMAHVMQLSAKYDCAILLIEHMNKDSTGTVKALYRGNGSIDFTAAARSVLLVGSNPDDSSDRGIAHIKSNNGKIGSVVGFSISDTGQLTWKSNSTLTEKIICGIGHSRSNGETENKLEAAKTFLKAILKDGKRVNKDVISEAFINGISEKTLRMAREELGITSVSSGFGEHRKTYWSMLNPITTIISLFDKEDEKKENGAQEIKE